MAHLGVPVAPRGRARAYCGEMRPDKVPDGGKSLPFDFTRAHHLYQALFGQVEDLTKGKHLLIVPSGPLTQIPFHVLVTEHPNPKATGAAAFRRAAWFAKSNSITVLPSVSSLKALREHAKTSHATKSYAGLRERSICRRVAHRHRASLHQRDGGRLAPRSCLALILPANDRRSTGVRSAISL